MWGMWWWPTPERNAEPEVRSGSAPDIVNETQLWGFTRETAARTVRGQRWRDLVLAWQLSDVALERARTCVRAQAIVTLRAAILDELEAQDPEAFGRWLRREWRRRG